MGEPFPAHLVRHAHHLGKLARSKRFSEPSGVDRQGGRRLDHPSARASLRFDEHEFKDKTTYGDLAGANLLDWPITLAEMEPWYAKAEDKMGVTRTNGIAGLPGNNNFKVLEAGARKLGYKEVHTGNMAINSAPRDGRGACQQIGFTASRAASRGRNGRRSTRKFPRAKRPAISRSAPTAWRSRSSMMRRARSPAWSMPTRPARCSGRRRAGGGRRQLDRKSAAAAQQRLEPVPGRARQLVGPGRPQLHAAHDRQRLCDVREIDPHVSRHHHGRHHPRRGEERSEARLRRRLRDGDALARPALHGGVPEPGRWGRSFTSAMDTYPRMAGMWLVGEDMPQEPTASRSIRSPRTSSACRSRACISTIIRTMSRCAPTPTSRARRSTRRSAPP